MGGSCKLTATGLVPAPQQPPVFRKETCRKLLRAKAANINSTRTAQSHVPRAQSAKSPAEKVCQANVTSKSEAVSTGLTVPPCSLTPAQQTHITPVLHVTSLFIEYQLQMKARGILGLVLALDAFLYWSWRLAACPFPHEVPPSDGPSRAWGQASLQLRHAESNRVFSNSPS